MLLTLVQYASSQFIDYFPSDYQSISYRIGSKVLTSGNLYNIYYGNWSQEKANIIDSFASQLAKSNYFSPTLEYYQQETPTSQKIHVSSNFPYKASIFDCYSNGYDDFNMQEYLGGLFDSGKLVFDPKGLYTIFISSDIEMTTYGGYHFAGTYKNEPLYISVVQEVKLQNSFEDQVSQVIKVFAHEIIESITNPFVNTIDASWKKWKLGVSKNDLSEINSENMDMCCCARGGFDSPVKIGNYNLHIDNLVLDLKKGCVNGTFSPIPLKSYATAPKCKIPPKPSNSKQLIKIAKSSGFKKYTIRSKPGAKIIDDCAVESFYEVNVGDPYFVRPGFVTSHVKLTDPIKNFKICGECEVDLLGQTAEKMEFSLNLGCKGGELVCECQINTS